MSADIPSNDLDAVYGRHRDRMFQALVLATGDPDLVVDAVDDAFAANARGGGHAVDVAAVYRTATSRLGRTAGAPLPHPSLDDPARAALLDALRRLDPQLRFAVAGVVVAGLSPDEAASATGTDRDGLERQLAADEGSTPSWNGLAALAGGLGSPLPRQERVMRHVRWKRLRKASFVLGGAAVVAVAAWAGVAGLTGPDTAPEGTAAPEQGEPAVEGELTVTWEQGGLPFEQGELTSIVATDDGFLAVGNDWNDPRGNSLRLLTSETGFDWEIQDFPVAQPGSWIQHPLIDVDGDLYGLTSSPAPDGHDQPSLIQRKDGEWAVLPIETPDRVEIHDLDIEVMFSFSSLSIDGDTLTAAGTISAMEDLLPLFEDALPEGLDAAGGWSFQNGGVDIYGSNGDVVASLTTEELGIPREIATLAESGLPTLWVSEDGGESWAERGLEAPDGLLSAYYQEIVTVPGGRVFTIIHDRFTPGLWSAEPGGKLERVKLEPGIVPTGIRSVGGDLYLAGYAVDGSASLWKSSDGNEWDSVGGETTEGIRIDNIRSSRYGMIANGVRHDGEAATVTVVVDDRSLVFGADGRVQVLGADGEVLAERFVEEMEPRPGGFVVVVDDGVELIRVSLRDLAQQWEQGIIRGGEVMITDVVLLMSEDGETWHRIEEDLPEGFVPIAAGVGTDRVLATGWDERGDGRPTVWIGTFSD